MRGAAAALVLLLGVAAASPAGALSRHWLCFLDTGSAELSPRCQAILGEFASYRHRTQRGEQRSWPDGALVPPKAMRVEVHGHVDRFEASRGKTALDAARAGAVVSFLAMNGMPVDLITTHSRGAARMLAPDPGPGPQNRRVEIVPR